MSAFVLRVLGKTEYGIYQTMTSFITYLALLEFGTGTIMTRNISLCRKDGSENEHIQKNVSTIWSITAILSIVIFTASLIFFFSIDLIYASSLTTPQRNYGKIIFAISVGKLILNFYVQTMSGSLIGFEHYSRQSAISVMALFFRTGLVIITLLCKKSAIAMVVIDLIIAFCVFTYTYFYCTNTFKIKFSFREFDRLIFRQMLPLAFAMFLQTIVNMANNNVDKFVIGIVMSPEAVAVYSVAMFIFSTFSSLTTIPISMYMPQIAKEMRDGKNGVEFVDTLIRPCRLIVLIGGAVLFGFIAVGRPFISIVYGQDFLEAWLIAVVVMIPMFINMTNGILVNVLDVLRKRHIRSICLGCTTIANIILTIWWISTWGMIGAAVATSICTFVGQVILMNVYYAKKIQIPVIYLFKKAYAGLLPGLMVSCVAGYLVAYLAPSGLLSFFLGGIVFCLIFAGSILLLKSNIYEKEIVYRVIHK